MFKSETPLGGVHKLSLQELAFFDHLLPSVYIYYGINVYKKSIFFVTTYPPPLVNVVCERLLIVYTVADISHAQIFATHSFPSSSFITFMYS